ncbi:MAG: 5-(carboxyamino)imidazole ribonucleotide mutase [Polyangia bacterium]
MSRKVLIVMGSANDLERVRPVLKVLDELEIESEVKVASAHRSPRRAANIAREARERGVGAIVAAAGAAHHLGGALAANTTLPVIALPIAVGTLGGIDSLLSAVQMPGGVPIAAVGIDGAKNAALLAAAILGVDDPELAERLERRREDQRRGVEEADARVQSRLASGS